MARIYHLVTAPELVSGLAANHYTPARFAEDGFVHCCADEASALAVARDYFADATEALLVLALDTARLDAPCVFEAPAPIPRAWVGCPCDHQTGRTHLSTAEKFPHVYGPLALRALRGTGLLSRSGRDFAWPAALGSLGESLAGALAQRLSAPELAGLAGLRRLRRETSRRLVRAPGRLVLELGASLVATGGMRERVLGSELVRHHPDALGKLSIRDAKRLAGKLASWADVDVFACAVAGQAFRDGRIPEAELLRWARSRDPFWRRAALVSTVPLNVRAQGGAGDPRRTLRICRTLVGDRADLVVKALSWALRALAERDPEAVRRFVAAQHAVLAARVLREVGTKLRTGRKN